MSTGWAAVAAVAAALCYGVASATQHKEASRSSDGPVVRVGGLLRLVGRPLWLAGAVADVGGLLLHVTALGLGPVTLVQPLQVTGLVFALPVEAVLSRRRVRTGDVGAALVVVAGLGLFLGLARSGPAGRALSGRSAVVLGLVTVAVLAAGAVAVRRAAPSPRAATLGGLAGAGFAVTAVLIEALVGAHGARGWSGVVTGAGLAELVSVVAVGAVALVLSQAAFQVGSLPAALPALTVVDPVLAVVLAAALLGERVHLTALTLAGFAVALVLVSAGVLRLAAGGDEGAADAAQVGAPDGLLAQLARDRRRIVAAAGVGGVYGLAGSVPLVVLLGHLDPDNSARDRGLLVAGVVVLAAAAAVGRRARAAG